MALICSPFYFRVQASSYQSVKAGNASPQTLLKDTY